MVQKSIFGVLEPFSMKCWLANLLFEHRTTLNFSSKLIKVKIVFGSLGKEKELESVSHLKNYAEIF
jgi:hypothetical protein